MTRSIGGGGGAGFASDHLQRAIGDVEYPAGVSVQNGATGGQYLFDPRSGQGMNLGGSGASDVDSSFLFDGTLRGFYADNTVTPVGADSHVTQSDVIDLTDSTFSESRYMRATQDRVYLLLYDTGNNEAQYRVADVDTGNQLFQTPAILTAYQLGGEVFASEAGRFFFGTGGTVEAYDDSDGSSITSGSGRFDGDIVAFPDGSVMGASNAQGELMFFSPDLSSGPEWTIALGDLSEQIIGHTSVSQISGMTAIDRNRVFATSGSGAPFVIDQNGDVVIRHRSPYTSSNTTVEGVSKSPIGSVLVAYADSGGEGYSIVAYPPDEAGHGTVLFQGNGTVNHLEAGPTVGENPGAHGL